MTNNIIILNKKNRKNKQKHEEKHEHEKKHEHEHFSPSYIDSKTLKNTQEQLQLLNMLYYLDPILYNKYRSYYIMKYNDDLNHEIQKMKRNNLVNTVIPYNQQTYYKKLPTNLRNFLNSVHEYPDPRNGPLDYNAKSRFGSKKHKKYNKKSNKKYKRHNKIHNKRSNKKN